MKIGVASGKGGTGKTMISTSLAATLAPFFSVNLIDCDTEAPNTHLFLHPEFTWTGPASVPIPEVDRNSCVLCGACVDVCQYHALAMIANQILVFTQLCHGCGSCARVCPEGAIIEVANLIGSLHKGITAAGIFHDLGVLSISEAMPTPIIHQLKALVRDPMDVTILDSPPGASCAVVATIYDADFVLLVTEPTPFGLHDLKQMLGIIAQTGSPTGIIINRDGIGDDRVDEFLRDTNFPVMMRIPYQEKIAEGLGAGQLLTDILPALRVDFLTLFERICSAVKVSQDET